MPLTCKFIEETRPRHSKNKIEVEIYVNICDPGIVLSTSCVITHSILTTFYRSTCHYCPHFTGEETERPRFRSVFVARSTHLVQEETGFKASKSGFGHAG